MENNNKKYIEELEDKISSLAISLKTKTRELESLETSHKKFIGKLIHNVKNPVGVIYSFSEMMLDGFTNYTPEKTEKHLRIIKNSSGFVIKFMNTLAEYSQLQNSNFAINLNRVSLTNLIEQLKESYKSKIESKNGQFFTKLPLHEIFVEANREYLTKAIKIILENAIRFSNAEPVVSIELLEKGNNIYIEISDNGIGIAETEMSEIFEEFHVVNTYSADGEKCIGLGLSIAKRIVELHSGSITVISNLEKGSKFIINLPKHIL